MERWRESPLFPSLSLSFFLKKKSICLPNSSGSPCCTILIHYILKEDNLLVWKKKRFWSLQTKKKITDTSITEKKSITSTKVLLPKWLSDNAKAQILFCYNVSQPEHTYELVAVANTVNSMHHQCVTSSISHHSVFSITLWTNCSQALLGCTNPSIHLLLFLYSLL